MKVKCKIKVKSIHNPIVEVTTAQIKPEVKSAPPKDKSTKPKATT
jgi:hypothetical protein